MGNLSAAGNPAFKDIIRSQVAAFGKHTPYHSLELLDGQIITGIIPVADLKARLDSFPVPEDLHGLRILDIGAASGWNSFEMERRGADVVAVDCVEYEEFRIVHQLRNSKVDYRILDVDEITVEELGLFDIVLFFGVLYHLRHPLLALEKVCSLTRNIAFIESYVVDMQPSKGECYLEFYEIDELGGQIDNWCGPTTECLMAMTRSAGFCRVEWKYLCDRRGGLIAHRTWGITPSDGADSPFLSSAVTQKRPLMVT